MQTIILFDGGRLVKSSSPWSFRAAVVYFYGVTLMAEGWTLKHKIVRSRKFRNMYDDSFAQLVYCLMIAAKDSYGILPADPDSIKAKLGPFDTEHTSTDYAEAVNRIHKERLIFIWTDQGDPWLYVIGHDEEHMTNRRAKKSVVPRPSVESMNEWADLVLTKSGVSPDLVQSTPDLDQTTPDLLPARAGLGLGMGLGKGEGSESGLESKDSLSIPQKSDTPKPVSRTGPLITKHTLLELDSQAENPVDPTPPGRPGSGSGISKAGDVADGLMGDTGKTAAIFEDPRPVGAEHDEILNLRQLHAKRFNYDLNPCAPVGDLSCRILDALREYGLKKCRAAIEGHFKEATKEGSSRGKGFEHAFPPLGRQKNKLDRDRFWTLITAGQKGSGKSARSTYKPTPKIPEDERQEAAAKGLAEVRKQLEGKS